MAFELKEMVGNWNYPTSMRFGAGRVAELPNACRELGIHRPLIVTDGGIAKLPMVDEILAIQEEGGVASGLFYEVAGNPDGSHVAAGVAALRERGEHMHEDTGARQARNTCRGVVCARGPVTSEGRA